MSNFNDDLELILNNLGMNGKFITDKLRVYDKYKNLADLVEQGRHIELPYKVGEIVYKIGTDNKIRKYVVKTVELGTKNSYSDMEFYDCIDGYQFRPEDFGKTVFLTRKEAEKALEEVKNNE